MAPREPPADDRSVLGRALTVLETFSAEQREQTLGSIRQRAGLPSATTHRLVAELVEWGALDRVGRGRYRIRAGPGPVPDRAAAVAARVAGAPGPGAARRRPALPARPARRDPPGGPPGRPRRPGGPLPGTADLAPGRAHPVARGAPAPAARHRPRQGAAGPLPAGVRRLGAGRRAAADGEGDHH